MPPVPDETISITSRGKQVFALMPWDLYESLNETIEIMSDPEMMKALKKGLQDTAAFVRPGDTWWYMRLE